MKPTRAERQQYWQHQMEVYQASGLSGRQYCEQTQLTYHCFIYWRRKLSGAVESVESTPATPSKPVTLASSGFISVRRPSVPTYPKAEEGLVLSLPNGLTIGNIQRGTVAWVPDLLAVLS